MKNAPVRRSVKARRRSPIGRLSYSVFEYGAMVGRRGDAVRREIERKAVVVGEELVAHLSLGVLARKPAAGGRWAILLPQEIRFHDGPTR